MMMIRLVFFFFWPAAAQQSRNATRTSGRCSTQPASSAPQRAPCELEELATGVIALGEVDLGEHVDAPPPPVSPPRCPSLFYVRTCPTFDHTHLE